MKDQPPDPGLEALNAIFARIPFNRSLGLVVQSLTPDKVSVGFEMRDELVGNFVRGSLHGGVISSTLDALGGLTAMLGALGRLEDLSEDRLLEAFGKLGTIDLRVDYLRPGIGDRFVGTGFILRTGNKVAVTRMELHADETTLIAVATGAYVIS